MTFASVETDDLDLVDLATSASRITIPSNVNTVKIKVFGRHSGGLCHKHRLHHIKNGVTTGLTLAYVTHNGNGSGDGMGIEMTSETMPISVVEGDYIEINCDSSNSFTIRAVIVEALN